MIWFFSISSPRPEVSKCVQGEIATKCRKDRKNVDLHKCLQKYLKNGRALGVLEWNVCLVYPGAEYIGTGLVSLVCQSVHWKAKRNQFGARVRDVRGSATVQPALTTWAQLDRARRGQGGPSPFTPGLGGPRAPTQGPQWPALSAVTTGRWLFRVRREIQISLRAQPSHEWRGWSPWRCSTWPSTSTPWPCPPSPFIWPSSTFTRSPRQYPVLTIANRLLLIWYICSNRFRAQNKKV